jgi:hypothetical protein
MNDALRTYLAKGDVPVTEEVLRHVLREEMPEYLRGLTTRSSGQEAGEAARPARRRSTSR